MTPRTIASILARLPPAHPFQPLPAPSYTGFSGERRVLLGVEKLRLHMTDEGHQLQEGLRCTGYTAVGLGYPHSETDVRLILHEFNPAVVVVQDKREWDGHTRPFQGDRSAAFQHVEALQDPSIFKATILKDAHQRGAYHSEAASEIGCHAWIVYYHPRIVAKLAPYIRPQHLIRTYHCVDPGAVPAWGSDSRRPLALLSGAVSSAYPLRRRLFLDQRCGWMRGCDAICHPGYHGNGPSTPDYLRILARYRVAVCTSSVYGYALRKIVEATACGCRVLTDLPTDDVLPEIDENLTRIPPDMPTQQVTATIQHLIGTYHAERQQHLAQKAQRFYDYRAVGCRLMMDIEQMRASYGRADH